MTQASTSLCHNQPERVKKCFFQEQWLRLQVAIWPKLSSCVISVWTQNLIKKCFFPSWGKWPRRHSPTSWPQLWSSCLLRTVELPLMPLPGSRFIHSWQTSCVDVRIDYLPGWYIKGTDQLFMHQTVVVFNVHRQYILSSVVHKNRKWTWSYWHKTHKPALSFEEEHPWSIWAQSKSQFDMKDLSTSPVHSSITLVLCQSVLPFETHTHTYTHRHKYTHTHMHTPIDTHHTHTHAHTHAHTHTQFLLATLWLGLFGTAKIINVVLWYFWGFRRLFTTDIVRGVVVVALSWLQFSVSHSNKGYCLRCATTHNHVSVYVQVKTAFEVWIPIFTFCWKVHFVQHQLMLKYKNVTPQ